MAIKKKKVDIPFYPYKLLIFIAEDLDALIKTLHPDEADTGLTGYSHVDPVTQHVSLFFQRKDLHHSMFNHEVFHGACDMLDFMSIPLTKDTHEVYAYLIQWMSEQVETFVQKLGLRVKP
jgi:hypothetical protein